VKNSIIRDQQKKAFVCCSNDSANDATTLVLSSFIYQQIDSQAMHKVTVNACTLTHIAILKHP